MDATVEEMRERVRQAADKCDVTELMSLVRMVRAFERRRGILDGLDRRRDRTRRSAVNAGLRELRGATVQSRQPLRVVRDDK